MHFPRAAIAADTSIHARTISWQGLKPEDLPEEEQFVTVRKRFTGMRMSGASGNAGEEGGDETEAADSFGFGEGGFYSFHSFRRKAHDFRDKWFSGWKR